MNRYLSIIFIITILFSQKYDDKRIELGNRGNFYKVWIYFKDKIDNESVNLTQKANDRRLRNNIKSNKIGWNDIYVSEKYKNEIIHLGFKIEKESRWLNAISIKCNNLDLQTISSLPFVKKIEPVLIQKKKLPLIDNSHQRLNEVRNYDYGSSEIQMAQINCIEAHNQGFYGQGTRVLYLDTGFDLSHESFDSLNLIAQYDFINDDENTANENQQEVDDSQDNHGTLCLSVLAGYKEGSLIGPAFKSEFLLAKTEIVADEIQLEEDNYVAGLEWGEINGADISCSSLGYTDWYEYEDMDGNTAVTTVAIDIASSLGVLCITSAGNSGSDEWNYIVAPADADSVISVGAVTNQGLIASFSSHGPTYDGRIKPEVCAMGVGTFCARSNTISEYRTASGTSLSAPLVGGAAAVVLSAHNNWSAMQIREALMNTALNSSNPDTNYGYGIINVIDAINYQTEMNIKNKNITINQFKVVKTYPNPFNPSIKIDIDTFRSQNLKIDIFNIEGKFIENIYNGLVDNAQLNLQWFPNNINTGVYIIRFSNQRAQAFHKVSYIK
jgi:serine protease AprX